MDMKQLVFLVRLVCDNFEPHFSTFHSWVELKLKSLQMFMW